ncbi:MAG: hypothetical protein ACLFWD_01570 [Anaerolineales bacterium]
MDINFVDPSEAPVPPEELEVRAIRAEPMPDQRRVKVHIELTPFQRRPTLAVAILDQEGTQLASTTIIESIEHILEFTMHLRGKAPAGEYRLKVAAGYEQEQDPVHVKETSFTLTE